MPIGKSVKTKSHGIVTNYIISQNGFTKFLSNMKFDDHQERETIANNRKLALRNNFKKHRK